MKSLFSAIISFTIVATASLVVAMLNGAPLIYDDSIYYFYSAKLGFINERPTLYNVFMRQIAGFEPVHWIIVHALITSSLLHVFWDIIGPRSKRKWLRCAVLSLLVVGTSLSFEASYLMPEFATGLMIVAGAILLAFWGDLSLIHRAVLLIAVALFLSFHMSHLAIMAGLALVAAAFQCLVKRSLLNGANAPVIGILLLVAVVSAGISTRNKFYLDTWKAVPLSPLFHFANFYSAGPLRDYLTTRCLGERNPDATYKFLCTAHQKIPRDWGSEAILWWPISPMSGTSTPKQRVHRTHAASVAMRDGFQHAPHKFVWVVFTQGFEQYFTLSVVEALAVDAVEEERLSLLEIHQPAAQKAFSAAAYQSLSSSLQGLGRFPAQPFFFVYSSGYYAGLVILVLLLVLPAGRQHAAWRTFGLLILSGVVLNALVCGGFSNVLGRYQLRVAWVPLFSGALWLLVLTNLNRIGSLQAIKQRPVADGRDSHSPPVSQW